MKRSIRVLTNRRCETAANAFTRVELLSICAAIGVLALLVGPALATNKSDSERMICFNNLRLIGRGAQVWAGDHNQRMPFWTPTTEGGLLISVAGSLNGAPRPGAAWAEYAFMSNEVATPKILACPSDVGVKRADNWSQFLSGAFRSSALSYPLHLHASADAPDSWLTADRNLRASPGAGGCSTGVNNIHAIYGTEGIPASFTTAWTNAVHGEFGHVLTTDGSVEFTSTPRLKEFMSRTSDDGTIHLLRAR